jgi:pimeloyl-ACP methyl ester carboxylesterase
METKVGGLRIAYERAGTGPQLVLVHGYVGDGNGTFRHQIDALSDEFTVVAWDGPGAGRSDDPPESWRMPDFADCLAGFIEALGLERPHVGGLSFGGTIAIELHRRHPTVPRSLILAGAYAGWAGSLAPDEVQRRLTQAVSMADLPPERFTRDVIPTMFSRSATPAMLDGFAANMSSFHPVGLRTMANAVAEADLREILPTIEIPTLLLYGDEDVRASVAVADAMHTSIPGSKLVVLPGVGHISTVEGADRFNEELRSFLRSIR